MKKRLFVLCLTLAMLLSTSMLVCAKEPVQSNSEEETVLVDNFQPRYIASCPSGGKHYMESKGWAKVYNGVYPNGTLKWAAAPLYQCKYCNDIIVTKTSVNGRDPIGEYTEWHYQESIGTSLSILYTTNYYYESSNQLSGYEFH